MKEGTDIAILLLNYYETYELDELEMMRLRRVIAANYIQFTAIYEGLYAAGHRHLAGNLLGMIDRCALLDSMDTKND